MSAAVLQFPSKTARYRTAPIARMAQAAAELATLTAIAADLSTGAERQDLETLALCYVEDALYFRKLSADLKSRRALPCEPPPASASPASLAAPLFDPPHPNDGAA